MLGMQSSRRRNAVLVWWNVGGMQSSCGRRMLGMQSSGRRNVVAVWSGYSRRMYSLRRNAVVM